MHCTLCCVSYTSSIRYPRKGTMLQVSTGKTNILYIFEIYFISVLIVSCVRGVTYRMHTYCRKGTTTRVLNPFVRCYLYFCYIRPQGPGNSTLRTCMYLYTYTFIRRLRSINTLHVFMLFIVNIPVYVSTGKVLHWRRRIFIIYRNMYTPYTWSWYVYDWSFTYLYCYVVPFLCTHTVCVYCQNITTTNLDYVLLMYGKCVMHLCTLFLKSTFPNKV